MADARTSLIDWSPHSTNQFVIAAEDLQFYEFSENYDETKDSLRSSYDLLSVNSRLAYPTCVEWCPDANMPHLLAAGLSSGKMVLTRLTRRGGGANILEVKPATARPVLDLAWNTYYQQYVAVGLDTMKFEMCALVWDVNASQTLSRDYMDSVDTDYGSGSADSGSRRVSEVSLSQGAASLDWLPEMPNCLAVGTVKSWFHVYDLRMDVSQPNGLRLHNGPVRGMKFDPSSPHRVATFSPLTGVIMVWDIRNLTSPIRSIQSGSRALSQIAWSPSGSGVLASVGTGEAFVKMWDFSAQDDQALLVSASSAGLSAESAGYMGGKGEFVTVLSDYKPRVIRTSDPLSSFSWSPHVANRALTISLSGDVEEVSLNGPIPLDWSPFSDLVFGVGKIKYLGRVGGPEAPAAAGAQDDKPSEAEPAADTSVGLSAAGPSSGSVPAGSSKGLSRAAQASVAAPPSAMLSSMDAAGFAAQVRSGLVAAGTELSSSYKSRAFAASSGDHRKGSGASLGRTSVGLEVDGFEAVEISVKMRERAVQGYSMDPARNLSILTTSRRAAELYSPGITFLWAWMDRVANLMVDASTGTKLDDPYAGVSSIFFADDAAASVMQTPMRAPFSGSFRVYKSQARDTVLRICNWVPGSFQDDISSSEAQHKRRSLERILRSLEKEQQYERAAALALFHLDMKRAIKALKSDTSNKNLRLIAMAFAGFANQDKGLWRDLCLNLQPLFEHPYLRAAFAFLSADRESFLPVLLEGGMVLTDRVAFAARFLSDEHLALYLRDTQEQLSRVGALEGVLLTGLGDAGEDLFANYVDLTSDVQTAVLAMSAVVPRTRTTPVVLQWIETYRDLLDRWKLWHTRAKWDVARLAGVSKPVLGGGPNAETTAASADVHARCFHCDRSLSHLMLPSSKLRQFTLSSSAPTARRRPKATSCPSCARPLPKCALCLLPLEVVSTANMAVTVRGRKVSTLDPGAASFDSWWSFCLTCRHGGHAGHMDAWFADHTECPVSGCDCACRKI